MEDTDMAVEAEHATKSSSFKRFGLKNSIQTNFGDDYVFQIVPMEDWTSIAVSLSSNTVKLYSPVTGQFVGECCRGHSKTINNISFSGHLLHSCSSDATLRTWDTRSNQQVSCLHAGPSQEIFSYSFGGLDGNLLAAGCKEQILFWDWRTKTQVACLEESHMEDVTQVQFVPDNQNKLVSASVDGLICIFDTSGEINDEDHLDSELFPDTDDANVRSLPLPALDVINNAKYVPTKKDFALRVHGINRPDNSFTSQSGQLTGNKNSAASDKPGPPDRIDMQKKIRDKLVSPCCTGIVQSSLTNFVTVNKRKHESISNTLSEVPLLRNRPTFHQSVNEDSDMLNAFSRSPAHQNMDDDTSEVLHQKEQSSEVDKNQREPSKGSMAEKGFTESDVSHSSKAIMDIQEFEEPTMEQLMTHSSKFLLPTSTTTSPPVTDNGLSLTYALVVLNQRLPTYTPLLWNRAQLRLCADGGANRVFDELPLFFPLEDPSSVRQRYKPDVIKGDMDSIRTEVLDFYTKMGTKVVDESQDQDTTDLHKCIAFIRDVIPHQEKSDLCILVAGALGGRFDHEVGNINVLCHFSTTRIVLLSDDSLIQLLPGTHRHEIHIQSSVEGPHCGLVPIGTPSASTTTTGLKWDLNNTEMRFGGLVSTSNIVKGDIVTVQSSSDLLWTISLRKP